jgi:hypothetical protein
LTSRSWQKGPKLSVNASCLASCWVLRATKLLSLRFWCIVFSSSNWCHRLVLCPVGRCTVLGVHLLGRYSDGGEALTRDVLFHIYWSISLSPLNERILNQSVVARELTCFKLSDQSSI